MAEAAGPRAIGLLLSGYGDDGTEGVRHIKDRGGLVICQTPETAERGDMPQSALRKGYCDRELAPVEMFDEIVRFIKNHPPR
ncbi:MAG: hypothetical protein HC880_09355 [Bacteroidia bacterium]|nr:hypothetical protein [Bacteroidia bacterium]